MLARADSGLRNLRAASSTTGRIARVSRTVLGSGLPSDHERLSPGASEVRDARAPACDQSGRGGAQLSLDLVSLDPADRKSTRLNSSHVAISYAVFCLKKKK